MKKKLWDKGDTFDALVEAFAVGDDYLLDRQLVEYDCLGSMAHAAMLHKIGILTKSEAHSLFDGLLEVMTQAEEGSFVIEKSQEDVHTAVENFLTERLGQVGRKLHTSRSRNDQVLVDLRLYTKIQIRELMQLTLCLGEELVVFAQKHVSTAVPGRTHMQRAMPSSLGLWAGAMTEALLDSVEILKNAYLLNDQSPLGAAASYGSNLPLDRAYTASLLGFRRVQNNVLYANNSRGKLEAAVVHALAQVMGDLSKMASDLMFFSLPEVGYMRLPPALCSGSSLMPQKHNPCALELIRARAATVDGYLLQLLEIIRPLPSGYHRDFQETKRPLMQAFDVSLGAIAVMQRMVEGVSVDEEVCKAAFTSELFATDRVLEMTAEGVPFRDAYQTVAADLESVPLPDPVVSIASRKHIGAPGNLGLDLLSAELTSIRKWLADEGQVWESAVHNLTNKACLEGLS